jgi:hypothetical protein
MTATLIHTSSRETDARLGMARVAAAGRMAAERQAREAREALLFAWERYYSDLGQMLDLAWDTGEAFCFICSRCTDHLGEHTDAQVAAYQADLGRPPAPRPARWVTPTPFSWED